MTTQANDTLFKILEKIQEIEESDLSLPDETKESLKEKVDSYHELITTLEGLRDAAEKEIDRLDNRVVSLEKKIDRIKSHVVHCMQTFGWEKLAGRNVVASLRKSESIEINNGVDFNDPRFSAFVRKKIAMSWDKTEIKKAMIEGEELTELARVKVSKNVNFK